MPRATRQRVTGVTGVTVAIGSLALVLAAAPFLPRGGADQGAVRPSAANDPALLAHATAGQSALTAAAEAEIDRVVNQGLTAGLTISGTRRGTPTTASLVAAQIRCADFEGQRYCLHQGWTDKAPSEVVANVTAEANQASQASLRATTQASGTGDEDILTTLRASARLAPDARAATERAELTEAAKAVAKVWLIRNQIEGVPLPPGFLDRHPEIRTQATDSDQATNSSVNATSSAAPRSPASSTPTPSAPETTKSWADYPQKAKVLDKDEVAEQTRTYYCGPTSMQMIAWGWTGREQSQEHWASRLGTTSSGSSISEMVRVTNEDTGWDRKDHAGPYIVLDIGHWSYGKWWLLNMRHVFDYKAPLILHPILLKQFYPYLDDDASGHFQVGRGYRKNGDKMNLIGFFEPWNQQRFDPSEPYISRVQWRSAYRSYRGNQAHSMHNIGV